MAINKAFIRSEANWCKFKLDELNFIDNYDCSNTLKDTIKIFYVEKIQKDYLFSYNLEYTEVDYDGFEEFVAYKENENGIEKIKEWYEYTNSENYSLNDLFGYDNDDLY